jgi:hypothetical protein
MVPVFNDTSNEMSFTLPVPSPFTYTNELSVIAEVWRLIVSIFWIEYVEGQ